MRSFQRTAITAMVAAALALSLAGCTDDDVSGPEGTDQAVATPEPTAGEEEEPTGTPLATEPETVDATAPEPVDPGTPDEVDGREVLPPVELDDAVEDSTRDATIWLERFTAVEDAGSRPGEIGGPAIQFDLFISNAGAEPLDLATLVVAVAYGDDAIPAEDVMTTQSRPLTGIVEPGGTVRGTLVFVVPPEERDSIVISVDLESNAPVIVFQGAAPQ